MKLKTFELERYFAKYEFNARYLLSCSDCEALSLTQLLESADAETLALWEDLTLSYTQTDGHPLLREEIAKIYTGIASHDVVVCVPEEGIFLAMNALLEPGDHVICTFPGYQSLYDVARSIGCEITAWLPDEAQQWHFDTDKLKRLLKPATKLVIVNFPHNPTGAVPDRSEFEAMIAILRARGVYLFSDEMYRFLELEETPTLQSGCESYERAVSLFGLSKTYGLPGLRMGWLVSKESTLLQQISSLKDYTTICNSAPGEILAIMALRAADEIIQAQKARVHRNLEVMDTFFQTFPSLFTWNRPKGGSICFPRMNIREGTHAFCERLVREAGVMLVPAEVFQFGERHVRIGFGRENFPEVLSVFAQYLKQHFLTGHLYQ